jgi:tetratricopeptide (TPR) repeat protein
MSKAALKKLFDQAHSAICINNFTEALECYDKVLSMDPKNDAALHFVAFLQDIQGNHRKAVEILKVAIENYPCRASYYSTLSSALRHMDNYPEAVKAIRTACELQPDAINLCNAATLLCDEKRFDRARDVYEAALDIEPESPFIHFNYALLLLKLGEYEEGWKEYDWRIPFHYNRPIPEYPVDLKGKKVRVIHEQGFGDFLMCARYLDLLRNAGAEVFVDCPKQLASLFNPHYCPNPDHTFMMMSLPRLFKEIPNAPFIQAPKNKQIIGSGFKVGIAFEAKKPFNNNIQVVERDGNLHIVPHPANLAYLSAPKRSLPHDFFDPFFRDGVRFNNLQVDTSHYAMYNLKAEDFSELADFVDGMDLIITIDTALAHLAGAMGKKTWLLLPYNCDWRWGASGENTIWYPSMKLFRQSRRGDWNSVQDKVLMAFNEL